MSRSRFFLLPLLGLALGISACSQDGGSGEMTAKEMMRYLPAEASGVFFVDVNDAMALPWARKSVQQNQQKLDDFIEKTGIDPVQDIDCLIGAVVGEAKGDDSDGLMVASLKVDPDRWLDTLREKHADLHVTSVDGVTMIELPEDGAGNKKSAAFLGRSLVALGTPSEVEKSVELLHGRAKSAVDNRELMSRVKETNTDAIFWAAFTISEDAAEEMGKGIPMGDLSGLRSVIASLDYVENALEGEIVCGAVNEEKAGEIANLLTGLKSFAAMGAAKKPGMAKILRAIEIEAVVGDVRITAHIPDDLLEGSGTRAE